MHTLKIALPYKFPRPAIHHHPCCIASHLPDALFRRDEIRVRRLISSVKSSVQAWSLRSAGGWVTTHVTTRTAPSQFFVHLCYAFCKFRMAHWNLTTEWCTMVIFRVKSRWVTICIVSFHWYECLDALAGCGARGRTPQDGWDPPRGAGAPGRPQERRGGQHRRAQGHPQGILRQVSQWMKGAQVESVQCTSLCLDLATWLHLIASAAARDCAMDHAPYEHLCNIWLIDFHPF